MRVVRRASRAARLAYAVEVQDEHEGALQRQAELRHSLPWRAAPFTTAVAGLAEAVPPPSPPPQRSPRGSPRGRHVAAVLTAANGPMDVPASPHIQGLQKLLVDLLREVGTATDPTHKSAAEEILADVRAQILSTKMAEESRLVNQQPRKSPDFSDDSVANEDGRKMDTELAAVGYDQVISNDEERDGVAAGLSGGEELDSWLVAQQQAQMEQVSWMLRADASTHSPSHSPERSQGAGLHVVPASSPTAPAAAPAAPAAAALGSRHINAGRSGGGGVLLARDGNSSPSPVPSERSERRRWRQQVEQQRAKPPPTRQLREQLALARAQATALEREQQRKRRQADSAREAAVADKAVVRVERTSTG